MTKKFISVLLIVIMTMAIMAPAASADDVKILSGTASGTLLANTIYTVPNGQTFTIPANFTLTIPKNTKIYNLGTVWNNGNITGGAITNEGKGKTYHKVQLPESYPGVYTVYYFDWNLFPVDETYSTPKFELNTGYYVPYNPAIDVYAVQGKPFYFTFVFDDAKYDISKLKPTVSGVNAFLINDVFAIEDATSTFTVNVLSFDQIDMRKEIVIPLPKNEENYSYITVAYYEGKRYENEVRIKYGDNFVFKLELDPLYDRSKATVTLGGKEIKPNDNGFYEVFNVTDQNGQAHLAYEILVQGIMENKSQEALSNAIGLFRDILKTVLDIIREFVMMLGLPITIPEI